MGSSPPHLQEPRAIEFCINSRSIRSFDVVTCVVTRLLSAACRVCCHASCHGAIRDVMFIGASYIDRALVRGQSEILGLRGTDPATSFRRPRSDQRPLSPAGEAYSSTLTTASPSHPRPALQPALQARAGVGRPPWPHGRIHGGHRAGSRQVAPQARAAGRPLSARRSMAGRGIAV
jgi:hypothetical protein